MIKKKILISVYNYFQGSQTVTTTISATAARMFSSCNSIILEIQHYAVITVKLQFH